MKYFQISSIKQMGSPLDVYNPFYMLGYTFYFISQLGICLKGRDYV